MAFEIILLFLGLVISLLNIFVKNTDKKPIAKNTLSVLYIFVCVLSIIVLFSNITTDKSNKLKLYTKLEGITKTVSFKSDSIIDILNDTTNSKLDSITKRTSELIVQRERSQKVFEEQNKLLEKSNQLTQTRILFEKPNIIINEAGIMFKRMDSTKSNCIIPFQNIGKRDATKFLDIIIFAFKNKKGYYFFHQPYNNGLNGYGGTVIHSDEQLITTSVFPFSLDYINENTTGGTIVIYYKYYDEELEVYKGEEARIDFNNKINNKIVYDNIKTGDPNDEIGLDEFLKSHNVRYPFAP
jgi:hypothetical protein